MATTTDKIEARKAKAKELQESIAAQVTALGESQEWKNYLNMVSSFHNYSLSNIMLILAQKPKATKVAGFKKWQEMGRQVRKGERAIKIYGFAQKTKKVIENGEEKEEKSTYFPMLNVFDISQTDVIEGKEDIANADYIVAPLTGSEDNGVYERLSAWLTKEGWNVRKAILNGTKHGYTTIDGTKQIVISETLEPLAAAKTLIHEAAHAILHSHESPETYVAHRGIKETEAESVAYVVAGALGLDTSAYSVSYVAGWSHLDEDIIKNSAGNVLKAAHTLLEAI